MYGDLKLTNGISLYQKEKNNEYRILQKFKWKRTRKRFYR